MVCGEKSYGRRHRCTDKIGMGLSIVAERITEIWTKILPTLA